MFNIWAISLPTRTCMAEWEWSVSRPCGSVGSKLPLRADRGARESDHSTRFTSPVRSTSAGRVSVMTPPGSVEAAEVGRASLNTIENHPTVALSNRGHRRGPRHETGEQRKAAPNVSGPHTSWCRTLAPDGNLTPIRVSKIHCCPDIRIDVRGVGGQADS